MANRNILPHYEKQKVPPIIVKFSRHDVKQMIYRLKKLLAKQPFLITECPIAPTTTCINKLKDLRSKGKIFSHWSMDGNIFYTKVHNGMKSRVKSIFKPNLACSILSQY